MVNCPTCGWSMKMRKEYEMGGFVFGNYYCASGIGGNCPVTVQVKAPAKWMREKGKWA